MDNDEKTVLQEKFDKVKDLRPIDDVFFEVLAEDPLVCQEILRTILGDDKLVVNDVIVQSSERNLYGRSVRLDALCTLGDGTKCNIEVQRSDNDDHLRRVRFNASSITVKESEKGTKFKQISNLVVVYISQFDIFGKGKTTYHVDKVIRETGTIIDDGLTEIFVNTEINDGTTISRLMEQFKKTDMEDNEFPELTRRVKFLKGTEGGVKAMCNVMERYEKIAADKAIFESNVNAIKNMLEFDIPKEKILTKYSKEEYDMALSELKK